MLATESPGWKYPSRLWLAANLFRSPDTVRGQADAHLRVLIAHAYEHIAFYRELWRSAGVTPGDIRSRDDLARLPMVTKEQLTDAGAAAIDQRIDPASLATMSTSGTSGRAIDVPRTPLEMRMVRVGFLRPLIWHGARSWHRVLTVASPWLTTRQGRLLKRLSRTEYLSPTAPADEQLGKLASYRPHGIVGQAGSIYLMASALLERGLTHRAKFVAVYGSTLMPDMRATMRQAFGVDPIDCYGCVETGWIAWQCRRRSFHIDVDRIILELLDDAGQPVPPGAPGHVVVTSLFGRTMPFIRYRLRDLASLSVQGCGCRLWFPVLENIHGRVNDYLPNAAGERISPHFFFHVFDPLPSPVLEWRLTQRSVDDLLYEYVPKQPFNSQAFDHGMNQIRSRFGSNARLETRPVAELPLTAAGKRKCIVSSLRPTELAGVAVWTGT